VPWDFRSVYTRDLDCEGIGERYFLEVVEPIRAVLSEVQHREYGELVTLDTLALGAEKRISPAWIKFISTILTIRLW
jgi:hypothetical protein